MQRQREFFKTGATHSYEYRRKQLEALRAALILHEPQLLAALKADLGKSAAEAYASELAVVRHELKLTLKSLKRWMRPRRVTTPLHLQPARSRVFPEPLGVVLVIGAWNYPVQLTLAPLIGALAAGCCAVVKPSELAPQTSTALRRLLESIYSSEYVSVVEGGVEPTTDLLRERFDHIFFTGSTTVGRIVYAAAAKNLTPVTLELGGKSPAIVCTSADLALTARRLVFGKFLNAGQTCVAPDYVYVDEKVFSPFLDCVKKEISAQFGSSGGTTSDYGRIVTSRHFDRLVGFLQNATILFGGTYDVNSRYFAPTVIADVDWNHPVMREEIFGPVLPVLKYKSLDQAFAAVLANEKPLAAYLFTSNANEREKFTQELSFGGGCINDTVVHLSNAKLPFGGVGASGIGAYHGEKSFQTFSHMKSVLHKSKWFDVWFRYPPYTKAKMRWLKRFL